MRLARPLALFTLFASPSLAQTVDAIELVDHGIYTARTVRQWREADGLLRNSWVDVCHILTTTKVPARLELILGFRYLIKGAPDGEFADLEVSTIFPRPIKPPGNARAIARFESPGPREIGETHFAAYAFDEPSELVTGRWTIEIRHQGRLRQEKSFDVVPDDGVRLPGGGRGSCFKAS